jgi:hypothetical protein
MPAMGGQSMALRVIMVRFRLLSLEDPSQFGVQEPLTVVGSPMA